MARRLESWGGDVRMPRWLGKVLRRQRDPGDTPERAHEARQPEQPTATVAENADRAAVGPLSALYREGRKQKQRR